MTPFLCRGVLACFCLGPVATGSKAQDAGAVSRSNAVPITARDYYNAGTRNLLQTNFAEAEVLLDTALAKQDEQIQPAALYNLGCVRFSQGSQELQREPSPRSVKGRGSAAEEAAGRAIQFGQTALAGTNLQPLVAAYLNGRGKRTELRAATQAVRHAMEVQGATLLKWRRALGDFRSAAELNPQDTNAVQNAHITEKAIARLVDSLHELQQMSMSLAAQSAQLGDLLEQLGRRIPKEMMPPGSSGDKEDKERNPESFSGLEEAPYQAGREMTLPLSPEEAAQLLDSTRVEGNRPLPADQPGQPASHPTRTW